ncbi:hypothetical protein PanWU01x14_178480 [Parasponia andersonii]|uniref:Uncharacterized protein n=1 Tax=Parasponia andersonii TaxID=3476 RepID=A0A2P5C757_PARAD|nr:hypothetical protein PanWU01x14_178480 [Parasponia andersonii]
MGAPPSDQFDPKGKRVKKETREFSVEKELRRLNTNRLKVEFCEKTGNPFLDYGKMFLNILTKTNLENRSKQLYPPAQESSSMIIQMNGKSNPDIVELMSPMDYFVSHHIKLFGWWNKYTPEKHAEMITSKTEIMSKALETRSRLQKEMGALPRLKGVGGQRAASTGQVTETILKQQFVESDAKHARRLD